MGTDADGRLLVCARSEYPEFLIPLSSVRCYSSYPKDVVTYVQSRKGSGEFRIFSSFLRGRCAMLHLTRMADGGNAVGVEN